MKISAVNNTSFQAKIKLNEADINKFINSDKARLVTGGTSLLAGTGSFLIGMDSWDCIVNSNVAERSCENFSEKGNGVLGSTASYASANSMPTGLLFSVLGIEKFLAIKDKSKKIPD